VLFKPKESRGIFLDHDERERARAAQTSRISLLQLYFSSRSFFFPLGLPASKRARVFFFLLFSVRSPKGEARGIAKCGLRMYRRRGGKSPPPRKLDQFRKVGGFFTWDDIPLPFSAIPTELIDGVCELREPSIYRVVSMAPY